MNRVFFSIPIRPKTTAAIQTRNLIPCLTGTHRTRRGKTYVKGYVHTPVDIAIEPYMRLEGN